MVVRGSLGLEVEIFICETDNVSKSMQLLMTKLKRSLKRSHRNDTLQI